MTTAYRFIIAFKTSLTQLIMFIFNFAQELIQIFFRKNFLTKLNRTYHNPGVLNTSIAIYQSIAKVVLVDRMILKKKSTSAYHPSCHLIDLQGSQSNDN